MLRVIFSIPIFVMLAGINAEAIISRRVWEANKARHHTGATARLKWQANQKRKDINTGKTINFDDAQSMKAKLNLNK